MPNARPSQEGSPGPIAKPKSTGDGIAVSIIAHRWPVANSTVVPLQARACPSTLVAKVPQTMMQTGYFFQSETTTTS